MNNFRYLHDKHPNRVLLSWVKHALATEFILMRKDGTTAGSWKLGRFFVFSHPL